MVSTGRDQGLPLQGLRFATATADSSGPSQRERREVHIEAKSRAEKVDAYYERYRQKGVWSHFDRIGFLNVGYWKGLREDSIELAQINLMETLANLFYRTDGNLLDVGCGNGATTRFMTKYFDSSKVTGINVSQTQLKVCATIAPECDFRLMDATKLDFADSSWDNILCIEAAFHFRTRARFFEEAYRVLKPAGRLVMLDVLYDYDALYALDSDHASIVPRENYLPDLDAYRDSLLKVGYSYLRVEDCTELTGNAACAHVVRMQEREYGRTPDPVILESIKKTVLSYQVCTHWGMILAIK